MSKTVKRYYVGPIQFVEVGLPDGTVTELRYGDSVEITAADAEALDACPENWSTRPPKIPAAELWPPDPDAAPAAAGDKDGD